MKASSKSDRSTNRLTVLLFVIYLIVLCWILLLKLGVQFRYMQNRSVNLIPFNDQAILTSENILNVLVFVPLGIYTAALFKQWTFAKHFASFVLCSLVIETLQYVLRLGAFDVTDIITNTIGGLAGLIKFILVKKAFNNHYKAQKCINIITATGTVLLLVLLALLKMNMLPVRYQ